MYQLLIFDWDGTLMDSALKISNCIQASARDVGLPEPTSRQARHIIGLGLSEAMEILFPGQAEGTISNLVEAYRHHWLVADKTAQQLFDGVVEGLNALQQSGALLSVATGKSRAGLNRAFAGLQMEKFFVTSRCADETRSKPHPQMLEEILEYTSIEPHKAIMIGDTTYDMEMARNASVAAAGVSYGVHERTALYDTGAITVVDSFAELLQWLQSGRLETAFSERL